MNSRWILLAAAAAIASGAFFLSVRPVSVEVAQPSRGLAVDAVHATGIVEPTVMLPIAPQTGGRLAELLVDEGASVVQGQVLARLDQADLAGTVEELEARAKYARSQYEHTQELVNRKFLAASERDRTRSELDAANAALKRARAQRDYMTMKASATGTVIRRDGEIGQYISAGQTLLVLACCAPLRVTVDVDEEDIARVQVGQTVVMRSDALPGKIFDGTVVGITPKGDPVSRSYRVRVGLEAPDSFRIGMTVDANIVISRRDDAILVPTAAVHDAAVWVIRDGRLHRQPVRTGVTGAERAEIADGLDLQTKVVLAPIDILREGERVQIKRSGATDSAALAAEKSAAQ